MDHDQRFKILIKEFFAMFLALFFREWAERLDCTGVEWLDKEVFPDPPQGDRRILDLVAKVRTRESVPAQHGGERESWLALVHIEIESPDKVANLRPRMYQSFNHLRSAYQLPVLPIGVYLQVGLDGVGVDGYAERFWEFEVVRFQYLYVGLPGLDAIEYVQGDNWLGVALSALMKIPRDKVAWLGAEALRRIKDAPLSDQQRFLLGECVQAYLPLDATQQVEFEKLLASESYGGVQSMNTTWYEKGMEIGIEKGIEKGMDAGVDKGRRQSLFDLLENRFGVLSEAAKNRISKLSAEQVPILFKKALNSSSLQDLGLED